MNDHLGPVPSRVLADAVRALNDIVSELVCGLASGDDLTRGYAFVVVKTLSEQTRALGGEPSVTPEQVSHWEGLS